MSPLALNKDSFSRVTTIVDSTISSITTPFAVHANSSSSTFFLSGSDIFKYLKSLETESTKLNELDLASTAADLPVPTTLVAKPAAKEKEGAKIEGAAQIAIGVKKEVDFASWYTNVSSSSFTDIRHWSDFTGFAQGGYAWLLQRLWLLYPQTLVF